MFDIGCLKEVRVLLGIKGTDMARRMGCTVKTVYRLEADPKQVRLETFVKYIEALEFKIYLSPSALVDVGSKSRVSANLEEYKVGGRKKVSKVNFYKEVV